MKNILPGYVASFLTILIVDYTTSNPQVSAVAGIIAFIVTVGFLQVYDIARH